MRLWTLLTEQSKKIQQRIAACITGSEQGWHEIAGDSAELKGVFRDLRPNLQALYRKTVAERYALTRQEFQDLFRADATKPADAALYLFHSASERYLPPQEAIEAVFTPRDLIFILCGMTKEMLLIGAPDSLGEVGKEALLSKICRVSAGLEQERDPVASVFLGHFRSPGLELPVELHYLAQKLGNDLTPPLIEKLVRRSASPVASAPSTLPSIRGLVAAYPDLFARKVLLVRGLFDSNPRNVATLYLHPCCQAPLKAALSRNIEAQMSALVQDNAEVDVSSQQIRLHLDSLTLLRKAVIIAALRVKGEFSETNDRKFKRSVLKKTAQIFGRAKDDMLEFDLIETLGAFVSNSWCCRKGLVDDALFALTPRAFQEQLIKERCLNQKSITAFVRILPFDRWIGSGLIHEFVRLHAESPDRELRVSCEALYSYIFNAGIMGGELDLAYTINENGSYTLNAIRRVRPDFGAGFDLSEQQLLVQPNFELLLSPNLDLRRLFESVLAFPLKDLHTLVITEKYLQQFTSAGGRAEELLSYLRRISSVGIPASVERLIHERVVARAPIWWGSPGTVLYLEDPQQLEAIRTRCGEHIRQVIDGRLVIFDDEFAYDEPAQLRRALIETGAPLRDLSADNDGASDMHYPLRSGERLESVKNGILEYQVRTREQAQPAKAAAG